MSLTELPPDRRAYPRLLLAGAVERFGRAAVRRWCEELLAGRIDPDDPGYPRIEWLGGTDDWQPYWARTWGGRGLLYVGPPDRPEVVSHALRDEHWRVREMALKVLIRHDLDVDGQVEQLLEDSHHRVRQAAERFLRRDAGDAG